MPYVVRRKSLLNKSKVEWTDYNCNHYVGCQHNCQYPCYARIMSKRSPHQWCQVGVVENALELAVKQIRSIPPGARIMVSSMTDPYQPIEREEKLTRSLLPVLAGYQTAMSPRVIIITKSNLVRRDFELIRLFPTISLCMTLTAMHTLRQWEPNAPGNPIRYNTLKEAHKLGIYTIASIEPWIPNVTKPLQIIEHTRAFVNEYFIGSLNHKARPGSERYKAMVRLYRTYLPLVKEKLEAYMKRYTIKKELNALVGAEPYTTHWRE